ncbi:SRPBCC family protein [Ramlibacter sp. PS4R-6]|uniref:SRPBCC family protein n=1 Tax=Ramlibacter sp. PS4R-6 TaxID=3133438 RepID=UPI0030B67BD1
MRRALAALCMFAAGQAFAAEKAIDREVVVAAKVDAVWQAWTTTEGIKTFFAPDARVELRVDGPFEIYFNPFAQPGMKGADGMRIIGFQPQRMLTFTWNAPPHLPEARANRSVVVLRFEPVGDAQTRVTLHHIGWGEGGEWDKAYDYFSKAWPNVLGNLQKRFASGPVDWTEWLARMKATQ